jgi:TonB-dependent receptor
VSKSVETAARARAAKLWRNVLLGGASTVAVAAFAAPGFAQDVAGGDESNAIVVTGIRASLERSMDIKRNADGVVDAITSEDIGKFPDTNLAEAMQRITGVSINRVNGEGSQITARGFGSEFNLVTLNGRAMPTATITTIGGGDGADFATGTTRQFDFSNIAAEGISGLEVYKTGRADLPTGGIGATVNVKTFKPLDAQDGFHATLGAKAVYDTTVVTGDTVTPEASGLLSFKDSNSKFGVSLFGSYQKRDSASAGATSNAWNVQSASSFLSSSALLATPHTVNNAPTDPNQLVTFPNDSRYIFAEDSRERTNGNLTVQFQPIPELRLTADAFYAKNDRVTQRSEQTNWFNRPFNVVTFSDDPVATALFLHETIGGVKDMDWEQELRSSEDTLSSLGFNADWVHDKFSAVFDAHSSRAWSGPNSSNGTTSTLVSIAAPVVAAHSLDVSSGFPVQRVTINDALKGPGMPGVPAGFGTNPNGVLDIGDVGSQVARTNAARTTNLINQVQAKFGYEFAEGAKLSFGADYRDSTFASNDVQTSQTLGDWGVGFPGDVQKYAPGIIQQFCMACQFHQYTPGDAQIAFRGNAIALYNALVPVYDNPSSAVFNAKNPIAVTPSFNEVGEKVLALYGQVNWKGDFAGMPANLLMGVRYENTDVTSMSDIAPPSAIKWQADNDFISVPGPNLSLSSKASYDNLLPSADFSLEFLPNVIGRLSFSDTIARPNYNFLFGGPGAEIIPFNNPVNRPTALAGMAVATSGDPGLKPLESENFDLSFEWYFAKSSYVSIGFFDKRVKNFIGTGVDTRTLYGLRDPSSGAAGTRSGAALAMLDANNMEHSDVNLFTATALIDQFGSATAQTTLASHLLPPVPGQKNQLAQAFIDQTLTAYDVLPNSSDPLFQFQVTHPINNHEGDVDGVELAFQHFFGDTGFGIQANYTYVDGDVKANVTADPNVDQFALLGLSDTANATLIYEKYGVSARLSYNWRDQFLAAVNTNGGNRNPLFVDPFGELDMNVSYDITPSFQVSFEGINLTSESLRTHARSQDAFVQVQELGPRYLFGARYKF